MAEDHHGNQGNHGNRRDWLRLTSAGLLSCGLAGALPNILTAGTFATTRAPKKVLFFTKSSGFPHSVITRKGDNLSHAEKILVEAGKKAGLDITASKDGRLFEPDVIGQWDAFAFYTTGDLTKTGTDKQPAMSPAGEKAFYEAVRSGKGFVGMHSATDTFGHHRGQGAEDPYIKLIGGEFAGHAAQQVAHVEVSDPDFPGIKDFGPSFKLNDEWYAQKNINDDLHVISYHITKDMVGKDYHRPDYPQSWARKEGKGRVFYTSMGHREDVWTNPKYVNLLINGLKWAAGEGEGDLTPNIKKVTPKYNEMPKG